MTWIVEREMLMLEELSARDATTVPRLVVSAATESTRLWQCLATSFIRDEIYNEPEDFVWAKSECKQSR